MHVVAQDLFQVVSWRALRHEPVYVAGQPGEVGRRPAEPGESRGPGPWEPARGETAGGSGEGQLAQARIPGGLEPGLSGGRAVHSAGAEPSLRPLARRAITAVAGVSGLVGLATSCGVGPRHTLSPSSLSSQIAAQLETQYGIKQPAVTCPSGVPDRKGQTFVCTATIDGQTIQMDGTATGSGRFSVEPRSVIISVPTIESSLATELKKQTHIKPVVDCGPKEVLVVEVGGTFACSAVFPGGKPRAVKVKVVNLQGRYLYQLAPAPATLTPGATAK